MTFKTADLIDAHGADLRFCDLPFRHFGRIRAFSGEIVTVKCFEDNALLKAELQKPGAGKVLVVDGGGSTRSALDGDVIAGILKDSGWAGVVINGAIRDSVEIDAMDVGLVALSTTPVKSKQDRLGYVGVPLRFGGIEFRPGERVYVDDDGVVVSERDLL